ncbi:hypothetical protein HAX54_024555 [Datura stramonium]|uniref:Uncharacterized protein n=1 Tax=Datura stramonium TaxID=4076 RepID=A0ABS8UYH8_DATST|nr:hypothetical protein [Datura stramonium]
MEISTINQLLQHSNVTVILHLVLHTEVNEQSENEITLMHAANNSSHLFNLRLKRRPLCMDGWIKERTNTLYGAGLWKDRRLGSPPLMDTSPEMNQIALNMDSHVAHNRGNRRNGMAPGAHISEGIFGIGRSMIY